MKDFYYILGTASNASPPEIDKAYQKLARKFRQAGEGDDEFMDSHFREITEAYDVLRDEKRRRKYDAAFKRYQKRQFAVFKLKYLNIAITLTFLVVTALFAAYVIRTIRGHTDRTTNIQKAKTASTTAVLPPAKKHHRSTAPIARRPLPKSKPGTGGRHLAQVPSPAPAVDSTYVTVLRANITGIVYLHQSADYNSAVLAKIPDGASVRVLQKGTAYYKVEFNGQAGYVLKSSIGKP